MKQILLIVCSSVIISFITACNGTRSEAQKQSELIQTTLKENSPGSISTSKDGYYLSAKLDGKEWSANAMMADNSASSNIKMIHAEGGDDVIKLQLYKPRIVVGKKVAFNEQSPANLFTADGAMYSGNTGEIEITKVDDQWIEGSFHFTATTSSSNAKVEVTDGRFRVASGIK
jgi:hypothetical protein